MKSIRLQSVAADFTKCWAKYMVDGKGEAFIKASSAILSQAQKKDGSSIAQSVLSSFIVPENSGIADLNMYQHKGTKVEPRVKVVLGCLSAIRSLEEVDGDGSSKDCLHSVLTGADAIAKTLVASTRTPEEDALLTEELRSLFLSLETDPCAAAADSGAAGVDVTSPAAGQSANYGVMNSFAKYKEDNKGSLTSTDSNNVLDPRLTAKARAALTFGAFRAFPFLSSLPVGADAVNGFLTKLTSTRNWGSAVHLLQLYPAQVSFTSFDSLLTTLFQAQEWDTLATLLLGVRKVLHAHNDGPKRESAVVATTPSEGSEHGPFLLELSPAELRQKVVHLVQSFIEMNTQGALTAAKKLANDYKLVDMVAQIEDQDMTLKFQNDIVKNKWQMTIQMLERKSMRKKLTFYNLLLQNERYWEAAEAYRSFNLTGTNAVLATQAQLDAQTLRHQTEFLAMAPALLDSVLVVNDHSSLQRAARELGLSLVDIPVSSTSTSTSVANFAAGDTPPSPSTTPPLDACDVDDDDDDGSSPNTPSSSLPRMQETAVRSVPFKTLLEQLRSDALLTSAVDPNNKKKTKNGHQTFFNGRYRQVVGLDGEWRAQMHRDLTQFGCSILQIAAPNRVYILDFRSLCPDVELQPRYSRSSSATNSPRTPVRNHSSRPGTPGSPSTASYTSPEMLRDQTRNFLHSLMSDPEVLKVGWDFLSEDIRMLRKNSKGVFTKAMAALNSYLEIKDAGPFILQQEARAHKKDATSCSEPAAVNVASLSSACDEFLGKPLLKFEQMSNWDRRPLRKAQVQYASLDAHATLALLDATLARGGVPLSARLGIADAYLSPGTAANTAKPAAAAGTTAAASKGRNPHTPPPFPLQSSGGAQKVSKTTSAKVI